MLFRQKFLDGIRTGAITLAFRRWRRPTVRTGGMLLTPVGQLEIGLVSRISTGDISTREAHRAGYSSLDMLLAELNQRSVGDVYRIELRSVRPDPRVQLRQSLPDEAASGEVLARLHRLDTHADGGAWTARVLEVLAMHPGVRAGDICSLVGMEKTAFKSNARKLKGLGLVESLGTGYRLSPRGQAIRAVWNQGVGAPQMCVARTAQ
jgi:hypothetical protein